jgi:hypothetical protein
MVCQGLVLLLLALVKLRGTEVRQKLGRSQGYIVHEQDRYIDYIQDRSTNTT